MDALIVLMRLLLPLVAILIYAPFTPHPLKTIALLEALIAFFVLLSWASITIQVEGDVIREIRFFLKSNLHHLRDIQRVSMTTEVGLFPSPRSVQLQFANGDVFILPSLSRSNLRQVLNLVQSVAPHALDRTVDEYVHFRKTTSGFVPGTFNLQRQDRFYIASGLIFLALILVSWLLPHFMG